MTFGQYVKDRRADLRISLREFCEAVNYDSANWSKIERGILPVPANYELFDRMADALLFEGPAKTEFMDRAMLSRGELPRDITENEYIMECLPAFVTTVREVKPTKEELENLIEFFRKDFRRMQP